MVQDEQRGTGPRRPAARAAAGRFRRRPAHPLRRHAAVPPRLDPRPAQPAPAQARPDDAAQRGGGARPALRAHHPRRRWADHRHHRADRGLARGAPDQRAECGRLRRGRGDHLSRAAAAAALTARQRVPAHRLRPRPAALWAGGGELPDLRPGRGAGHQQRRRPGLRRLRAAEAALPSPPPGGAQRDRLRHRRLAGHHRRRLYHAQRAPSLAGAGQRDHAARPRTARRGDRLRPALPLRPGRRRRGRGLCRQQHPGRPALGGRAHPADHLRHRRTRRGLRPGLHRQPQPARVERPQGLSRRRLAVARRRDARDRGRGQPAGARRGGQDRAGPGRERRAWCAAATSPTSTWTPSSA